MTLTPATLLPKILRRLRLYKQRALALRRKLIRRPRIFEDGYSIDDGTVVTLYTARENLFPGYQPRVNPREAPKQQTVAVTLVSVAKNEADTARAWYENLLNQTRLPDEIVVVDTGSTDETMPLLRKLAENCPVPFRLIAAPGVNISQGRNLAIQAAQHEHIAVTDFGTRPHPNWLETLVLPFEADPQTEVSGGWYEAIGRSGEPYRWRKWISLLGKNPQEILSPSVSIAFTRAAWQRADGYPEWLTMTGEDTYFDLELKRTCRWWAFSPEALVDWEAPASTWAYWKKMYRWSTGDGETGMRATAYWYAAIVSTLTLLGIGGGLLFLLLGALLRQPLVMALGGLALLAVAARAALTGKRAGYSAAEVVLVMGILAAQAAGFVRGALRRDAVTLRRLHKANRITFVLAGIPIDDTGGGARSTQLALELLRRQHVVCYINMYPKSESVELHLQIRHPNLITIPASSFSLEGFCRQYQIDLAQYEVGAVVELPHAAWLPTLQALRQQGAKIVYELIDEWDSGLGEGWYSREVELQTTQLATALTATAGLLQERLKTFSGKPVGLLPNAVNLRLFNVHKPRPIPEDLPRAELTIVYIGALYGSWFDWDLLVETARAYPQASVVVIGDYRGQCPVELPNLRFLGLKPQTSLPAYLAQAGVAIIPWKVNEITLATSPLKLYEYLAMRVPVVAPDLPPLRGIPAVRLAGSHAEFIAHIRAAAETPLNEPAIDAFIRQNSWESRVDELEALLGFAPSAPAPSPQAQPTPRPAAQETGS